MRNFTKILPGETYAPAIAAFLFLYLAKFIDYKLRRYFILRHKSDFSGKGSKVTRRNGVISYERRNQRIVKSVCAEEAFQKLSYSIRTKGFEFRKDMKASLHCGVHYLPQVGRTNQNAGKLFHLRKELVNH